MRQRFTIALTAVLLSACQGPAFGPSSVAPDDPLASAPPIERGLDAQGLSALLSAELAGQRKDFPRAAQGYLETAERYDSPELARRAVLAARYSGDQTLLQRAARLWQALADDDAPVRLLAELAMERGDWQDSLTQRLALARQGNQADLLSFVEAAIEEEAALPPLLDRLREFISANPGQSDAIVATALLEAAVGDSQAGEARLASLAKLEPDLATLWLVRGRIALQDDRAADARRAARQGLEAAPDDSRFILMLAQSQLRLGNVKQAEAGLDTLLARHPNAPQLRLALAQLYLEEDHNAPARRLLLPLIEKDSAPSLAYILLGAIAEDEGEVDNALLYYRQVPPGDGFLEARLRAAHTLIEAGRLPDARKFLRIERLRHPEQRSDLTSLEVELLDDQGLTEAATQLLDQSLQRHPGDVQLRFSRAMRRYEKDDLAGMERDLRYIIEREPDNADALNALGYTLVDVTQRHEEGLELIERAHELQPDSPAILDSLGWAHHKLGDDERALPYLQDAYAGQPGQEIAAHLAEVLWQLGRRDEARNVVAEALQRFDDRPTLDALLERRPALVPAGLMHLIDKRPEAP